MHLRIALALLLLCAAGAAAAGNLEVCPGGQAAAGQRYLAVISDLHIGNGRNAAGAWHRTEDFRWDGALETFLRRMNRCSGGRTDLVIAGDLLELWQPLPGQRCKDKTGCTRKEMVSITESVLKGHPRTMALFKAFASHGSNKVHVVPGNHDATLLLPEVWRLFHDAVGAPPGRVNLVANGLWLSADGLILVEHGHQIGSDANSYAKWPDILRDAGGRELVVQPWGEAFVQALFNEEEERYPIIDNLSPEAAGVRYRIVDRGFWRSAADIARFLAFNLFETSLQQKEQGLGPADQEQHEWDVAEGRAMGHKLFANALPTDDPFRQELLKNDDPASVELQKALAARAADSAQTPDTEVRLLCDLIAIRNKDAGLCAKPELGAFLEKNLVPRKRVMADHLKARRDLKGLENIAVFIYGHTHMLEVEWDIDLSSFVTMTVLNSGAFQRVVDEEGFLARVKKKPGLTPAEALRAFSPDNLAPCYTAVLVPYNGDRPSPRTVQWLALEGAAGRFVSPGDARCK